MPYFWTRHSNLTNITSVLSFYFTHSKVVLALQRIATTFVNQRKWKTTFAHLFCTDLLMLLCSALSHLQTVNPHSTGMLAALTNSHTVHSLVKHPRGLRKKIGSSILVSTKSKLQHRSLWSNLWHNDFFVTAVDMFSALQLVPEFFVMHQLYSPHDKSNKIHTNCHCFQLCKCVFICFEECLYIVKSQKILVSTSSHLIRKIAIRKWSREFKVEMSQTCTF